MTTIILVAIALAAGAAIGWLIASSKSGRIVSSLESDNKLLRRELELLNEQMLKENERRAKDDEQRERHYAEQLKTAQEQVKNTTAEILRLRAAELNQSNASQMSSIIEPLKEKIKEMQAAMESSKETSTRNAASLQQALDDIMKRTASIGDQAGKLAKALRHENKVQGNWGEAILSELLESQGLREGVHYDVQATLKDKNGKPVLNETTDKRMIPDVILNYSTTKAVIIDSKVSLSAFLDYVGAPDEETRKDALDRHLKSIRSHVKELSAKNYKRYILPPRESLDYMIMFVPNESALQLALVNDPSLWREALAAGVFIAGEYNLIAALRIIRLAWIQEVQAAEQRKVFDEATSLIERVGEFFHHFKVIRERIDKVTEAYNEAEKKLKTGRQSLLVPAQRLKEMGYKDKDRYPLPDDFTLNE